MQAPNFRNHQQRMILTESDYQMYSMKDLQKFFLQSEPQSAQNQNIKEKPMTLWKNSQNADKRTSSSQVATPKNSKFKQQPSANKHPSSSYIQGNVQNCVLNSKRNESGLESGQTRQCGLSITLDSSLSKSPLNKKQLPLHQQPLTPNHITQISTSFQGGNSKYTHIQNKAIMKKALQKSRDCNLSQITSSSHQRQQRNQSGLHQIKGPEFSSSSWLIKSEKGKLLNKSVDEEGLYMADELSTSLNITAKNIESSMHHSNLLGALAAVNSYGSVQAPCQMLSAPTFYDEGPQIQNPQVELIKNKKNQQQKCTPSSPSQNLNQSYQSVIEPSSVSKPGYQNSNFNNITNNFAPSQIDHQQQLQNKKMQTTNYVRASSQKSKPTIAARKQGAIYGQYGSSMCVQNGLEIQSPTSNLNTTQQVNKSYLSSNSNGRYPSNNSQKLQNKGAQQRTESFKNPQPQTTQNTTAHFNFGEAKRVREGNVSQTPKQKQQQGFNSNKGSAMNVGNKNIQNPGQYFQNPTTSHFQTSHVTVMPITTQPKASKQFTFQQFHHTQINNYGVIGLPQGLIATPQGSQAPTSLSGVGAGGSILTKGTSSLIQSHKNLNNQKSSNRSSRSNSIKKDGLYISNTATQIQSSLASGAQKKRHSEATKRFIKQNSNKNKLNLSNAYDGDISSVIVNQPQSQKKRPTQLENLPMPHQPESFTQVQTATNAGSFSISQINQNLMAATTGMRNAGQSRGLRTNQSSKVNQTLEMQTQNQQLAQQPQQISQKRQAVDRFNALQMTKGRNHKGQNEEIASQTKAEPERAEGFEGLNLIEDLTQIDPNSRTQKINFHHFDTFNTKSEEDENLDALSQAHGVIQYTQEVADSANYVEDQEEGAFDHSTKQILPAVHQNFFVRNQNTLNMDRQEEIDQMRSELRTKDEMIQNLMARLMNLEEKVNSINNVQKVHEDSYSPNQRSHLTRSEPQSSEQGLRTLRSGKTISDFQSEASNERLRREDDERDKSQQRIKEAIANLEQKLHKFQQEKEEHSIQLKLLRDFHTGSSIQSSSRCSEREERATQKRESHFKQKANNKQRTSYNNSRRSTHHQHIQAELEELESLITLVDGDDFLLQKSIKTPVFEDLDHALQSSERGRQRKNQGFRHMIDERDLEDHLKILAQVEDGELFSEGQQDNSCLMMLEKEWQEQQMQQQDQSLIGSGNNDNSSLMILGGLLDQSKNIVFFSNEEDNFSNEEDDSKLLIGREVKEKWIKTQQIQFSSQVRGSLHKEGSSKVKGSLCQSKDDILSNNSRGGASKKEGNMNAFHKRKASFSKTMSKATLLNKIRLKLNKQNNGVIMAAQAQNQNVSSQNEKKTPKRFIIKRSTERNQSDQNQLLSNTQTFNIANLNVQTSPNLPEAFSQQTFNPQTLSTQGAEVKDYAYNSNAKHSTKQQMQQLSSAQDSKQQQLNLKNIDYSATLQQNQLKQQIQMIKQQQVQKQTMSGTQNLRGVSANVSIPKSSIILFQNNSKDQSSQVRQPKQRVIISQQMQPSQPAEQQFQTLQPAQDDYMIKLMQNQKDHAAASSRQKEALMKERELSLKIRQAMQQMKIKVNLQNKQKIQIAQAQQIAQQSNQSLGSQSVPQVSQQRQDLKIKKLQLHKLIDE